MWSVTWFVAALGLLARVDRLEAQGRNGPLSDSATTRRTAIEAAVRFLSTWRNAWLASDYEQWSAMQSKNRMRTTPQFAAPSNAMFACVYAWAPPLGMADPNRSRNRIGSTSQRPSLICPSWTVERSEFEESDDILDNAITPARRPAVIAARDTLLRILADLAKVSPNDEWILGQRIRFLLDQKSHDPLAAGAAIALVAPCKSNSWWCATLEGYISARDRQWRLADEAFTQARTLATAELRCQTAQVIGLMDRTRVPTEFREPTSCAEKSALSERFWWLSDPLWSDSINERRIEHEARTVSLLLSASMIRSERFDWSAAEGGDAAAQLITRYGWPSRMVWSGINQGRFTGTGPTGRSIEFRTGIDPVESAPSPPFTTQEYSMGRVHLAPSWSALIDPYSARSIDWELNAPEKAVERKWWPSEHMRREPPLRAINDYQTQVWRRSNGLLLSIAARAPREPNDRSDEPTHVESSLIWSKSPSSTRLIASALVRSDFRGMNFTILSGEVPGDSALASLEFRTGSTANGDMRTRFAIPLEMPLREMPRGSIGLSRPMLVARAPRSAKPGEFAAPPQHTDSAIAVMLPSTSLRASDHLAIYWESYGFKTADTVEFELHVQRVGAAGKFERIFVSLGIGDRENEGTQIRWRENTPGAVIETAAELGVHGRGVSLNLASLRPGDYFVSVTVKGTRSRTAASTRAFTILPES